MLKLAKRWSMLLIPAGFVFFTGCSNDSSKDLNQASTQVQQKTQEAAGQIQNKTEQLSYQVQKEAPGIAENMKSAYQTGKQKAAQAVLQKGDKATTKKDVYMASSLQAYDELYQLIRVNNLNGIEKAEENNQVIKIKAGTKVEVLERDLIRTRIRTLDTNKEGYLPSTLLEKM